MVGAPPPSLGLGAGGEFRIIERGLVGARRTSEAVRVGPGDDAAVIDAGPLVVTMDLAVEGIHFRRDWMTLEQIGERCVRAALSDVAAMAGEPAAVLLALGVDAPSASDAVPRLLSGARLAAEGLGATVAGGDLSRVPEGAPWVVDVVCLGRCSAPVLRSGGMAGDELWVTGHLGAAAAAVAAWSAGQTPDSELMGAFLRPEPRIAEARWLQEKGVLHALLDLSDGLVGDAGHLASASGLDLDIRVADLPIAEAVLQFAPDLGRAQNLALAGGEDYELALLVGPGTLIGLVPAFEETFGVSLTCVGRARAGQGDVRVVGRAQVPAAHDHFRPGT